MPTKPTCGHPDRPVFSSKKCKQCATIMYAQRSMERKKEKGAAPRKKVNPVSDNQRELNKIYKILAAELKPLHTGICEGRGLITGCTGTATEIHHAKGRYGIMLIISRYFKYLCPHCHDFCTEHSDQAKELGLSMPINSKTDYVFTDREKELIGQFGIKLPKNVSYDNIT